VPADAAALAPNGELKLNPELHPANGSASMIATTAVLVGPKAMRSKGQNRLKSMPRIYAITALAATAQTQGGSSQGVKISVRNRVIATLYSRSARSSEGFCGCVKACWVPL
jgi:hypothetical protein